jgi:hypothetical protein
VGTAVAVVGIIGGLVAAAVALVRLRWERKDRAARQAEAEREAARAAAAREDATEPALETFYLTDIRAEAARAGWRYPPSTARDPSWSPDYSPKAAWRVRLALLLLALLVIAAGVAVLVLR